MGKLTEQERELVNKLKSDVVLGDGTPFEVGPEIVGLLSIIDRLAQEPEVVHCVDCFYGTVAMKQDGYLDPPRCDGVYCYRFSHDMDFTDYCSCGKPKDGERKEEQAWS